MNRRAWIAWVAGVTLLAGACTSTGAEEETGSTGSPQAENFEEVPCPTDVSAGIVTEVSCGYLTVPEDRGDPDGTRIRLFVARVQPPGGEPAPDPMLVVGVEAGVQASYGAIAPLSQRVNREVIFLDHRGSAHSEPLLACPEIEALQPSILSLPVAGDEAGGMVIEAAATCADRLRASGVNLDAYDLEAMAADAEDLRLALGIDEWNAFSLGSMSLLAFEIAKRYPESLRSIVLAAPAFPEVDPVESRIRGTQEAVVHLSEACAADPACGEAFGDVESTLRASYETAFVEVDVDGTPVLYDAAVGALAMVEGLNDTETIPVLPWAIRVGATPGDPALAEEVAELNRSVAEGLADSAALCYGLASDCLEPWAHGAHLSVLCADRAPFIDPASADLAGDQTWYVDAFAPSLLVRACEGWDVAPSDAGLAEPFTGQTPVFVIIGEMSATPSVEIAQEAVGAMPNGHLVVVPGVGSNPLGAGLDCAIEIRNAWVDDPTSPPDTSCLSEVPPVEFVGT
jgi:pimeloyl-ACP methyl ester carboxylesterase